MYVQITSEYLSLQQPLPLKRAISSKCISINDNKYYVNYLDCQKMQCVIDFTK